MDTIGKCRVLFSFLLFGVVACQSVEEPITDSFYLDHVNGREDMSMSVEGGEIIVPACVYAYAISFDSSYIFAKQHPVNWPTVDKTITHFYLVPVHGKGTYAEQVGVIGPLNESHFLKKISDLRIGKEVHFKTVVEGM